MWFKLRGLTLRSPLFVGGYVFAFVTRPPTIRLSPEQRDLFPASLLPEISRCFHAFSIPSNYRRYARGWPFYLRSGKKRWHIPPPLPPRFNVFFVRFLLSVWINSVSLVSFLFFFFFRFKISNSFKLLIILQLFIIIRDIDVINKYEIFLLKRLIFHRQKQNCIYLYYYFPRSNFNHTTYVQ